MRENSLSRVNFRASYSISTSSFSLQLWVSLASIDGRQDGEVRGETHARGWKAMSGGVVDNLEVVCFRFHGMLEKIKPTVLYHHINRHVRSGAGISDSGRESE